ncbi:MAG: flagellar export chaperone FliS [Pseudomonadota bacterium]
MYRNGARDYQKTDVMTSDPKRLVLMCYEGAIDNLKIAKQKIAKKEYEGKSKAIVKAQDIISELLCSLNFEKGGEIARNLESLYNYMLRRIIHADVNRDMATIDEIVGILDELRDAWEQAFYKKDKGMKPQIMKFFEDAAEKPSDSMRV